MSISPSALYGECSVCGFKMLPVLDPSPCGHDVSPTVLSLECEGIVYSWTRVWSSEDANALLVMADFMGGLLRVIAPLGGTETVDIGDRVTAHQGGDTPLILYPAGAG